MAKEKKTSSTPPPTEETKPKQQQQQQQQPKEAQKTPPVAASKPKETKDVKKPPPQIGSKSQDLKSRSQELASKSQELAKVAKKAAQKKPNPMQNYLAYGVLGGVLVLFLALVLLKTPVKTDNYGNNSESLNYLIQGINSFYGQGVTKDTEKGIEYLKKAANLGQPEAQHRLGYIYATGDSEVPINYEEAYSWYSQAAKQGVLDSMVNLGMLLANGQGVEQNIDEALKWWRKSANRGSPIGTGNMGRCHEVGFGVEKNFDKALEFYKKGVLLEDINSIYHLANMYLKGLGTVKDKQKAIELLKLGVDKRSVICLSLLGEIHYQDGEYAEAIKLLSPAAEAGEPKALYLMGVAHGTQIPDQTTFTYDLNKANEYYQKAALAGSHEAMFSISQFYKQGAAGADDENAFTWLMKAAKAGNGDAIAEIYTKNGSEEYGGRLTLSNAELKELLQSGLRSDEFKVRQKLLKFIDELEAAEKGEEEEEFVEEDLDLEEEEEEEN